MIIKKMSGYLIDDKFISNEEFILEFEKLKDENKELRELINYLAYNGMDNYIATRLEELSES